MNVPESEPKAPPAVEATRWLAVASLLALIALGLAWELWLAPQAARAVWALKVLPLTVPVKGLLVRRLYTYRWVSLLVWPYFMEGVVLWNDRAPVAALARIEVLLCVALFAACAIHVRLRLGPSRKSVDTASSPS
ncbi:MAG TPA: DUF2069 domain-containing protein [Ramlibacter sp.]|uniref:DUF2069 domain-containing protein n=1 Tax=Ramlibacter sp. TaxID=1917967 RepID=UPI002CF06EE5|nr:DUF2069 domain-containing protein [Ramlibacter sp.]HVZ44314.1 DUF2069 domain-containing protein [Ramlibacter sp.]